MMSETKVMVFGGRAEEVGLRVESSSVPVMIDSRSSREKRSPGMFMSVGRYLRVSGGWVRSAGEKVVGQSREKNATEVTGAARALASCDRSLAR